MGYDNEFDNKINKLTDFINECNSIVFFGGAGVVSVVLSMLQQAEASTQLCFQQMQDVLYIT